MTATIPAAPASAPSAPVAAPVGAAGSRGGKVRYPLDPIRAGAALAVVMFHVYQYQFGDITQPAAQVAPLRMLTVVSSASVDLFFVISGFLLYLGIARAGLEGRSAGSASLMLMRRVARLYPLYAVTVLLVWGVTNTRLPGVWQDLVLHLTMTQIYSQEFIFWTNGPAWSLAVEFHFYVLVALVMPGTAWACARVASRRGRTLVLLAVPGVLAAVGLAWLGYSILVARTPVTHWPTWFGFVAKAPMFATGMVMAVFSARGVRMHGAFGRRISVVVGAALAAVALALGASSASDTPAHEGWHLVYAVASVLVLGPLVFSPGTAPRVLTWRPLVFLGAISYGIYILHEPVMRLAGHLGLLVPARPDTLTVVLGWLLVSGAAVFGAWISRSVLEGPALKLLAVFSADGRRREYYPHLVAQEQPAPTPRLVPLGSRSARG